ncbi:MAG: hypothetical protein KF901_13695 [Myxococcales bacterium]|nr:hypothetical protein [Myxococcales bacterium]
MSTRPMLAVLVLAMACGDKSAPPPEPPAEPTLPTPDLRVVALTDLEGYLEPCGCTSRPLGGVDRMAARLRALSTEAPTIFVAAGDLLLGPAAHGADAATQERWRAETLAAILDELGLVAAVPGPTDLRDGPEVFFALRQEARFATPVLGADLPAQRAPDTAPAPPQEGPVDGPPALVGVHRVTRGESLIDLLGLSATLSDDPRARLRDALEADTPDPSLRLALVVGDRRLARDVASTDGIDFVVLGGLSRVDAMPPSEAGSGWVLHGGRHGQGLLVLDLYRPAASGPWTDVSRWSVETERESHRAEMGTLEARLGEWSAAGRSEAELAPQRARLQEMRDALARLRAPALPAEGRAFAARWEPLDPDAARDPGVRARLDALDRRINDHNRVALADRAPPPADEGAPTFVGSTRCQSCHTLAYQWWEQHPHGRAYDTLTTRRKEFHLDCVGCHVTGYERPGGASVTQLGDAGALRHVGCESCHGPGSDHLIDPRENSLARDTPAHVCTSCHNEEHSDRFVYEAYRATLLVPGHGRPAE